MVKLEQWEVFKFAICINLKPTLDVFCVLWWPVVQNPFSTYAGTALRIEFSFAEKLPHSLIGEKQILLAQFSYQQGVELKNLFPFDTILQSANRENPYHYDLWFLFRTTHKIQSLNNIKNQWNE